MQNILLSAILGICLPISSYSQTAAWPSLEDPAYGKYFLGQDFHPVIEGHIIGLPVDSLRRIEISYSLVTPFYKLQEGRTAKVNDDGSFRLELDYPHACQQVWLSVGDLAYMEIDVRRKISVTINASKIHQTVYFLGDGLTFGAEDGVLTQMMNQHTLFRRKEQLALDSISQMIRMNRSISHQQFAQRHDSVFAELEKIDHDFIEHHPSPYSWIIDNERLSTYYGDICLWYGNQPMLPDEWNRVRAHKAYLISNAGMTYYRYINMYLLLNNYRTYRFPWVSLMNQSGLAASAKENLETAARLDRQLVAGQVYDTARLEELEKWANNEFAEEITNDRFSKLLDLVRQQVDPSKADFLKLGMGDPDLKTQSRIDSTLLAGLQPGWCRRILEAEYGKLQMQLANIATMDAHNANFVSKAGIGEPLAVTPFGAKLYRVDSIEAKTFLANLKKTFANKAIIIDFWATWCGPCLSDMPYSKKIHDKVKDEPVEFVYLCTSGGSTLEKWKTKIMELELPGTHIFVDNAVEMELMRFFSFGGYPSIAFYNKEGHYVGNAIHRMSAISAEELVNLIHGRK